MHLLRVWVVILHVVSGWGCLVGSFGPRTYLYYLSIFDLALIFHALDYEAYEERERAEEQTQRTVENACCMNQWNVSCEQLPGVPWLGSCI